MRRASASRALRAACSTSAAFFAALRHRDRHLAPELGAERVRKQVRVVGLVAREDHPRRGLVAVELSDERLEDLAGLRTRAGPGESTPGLPQFWCARMKNTDAGVAAFLVECDHVRLLHRLGVDALAA